MSVQHEHEPTVYHESSGPSMALIVSVVAIVAVVIVGLLLFDGASNGSRTDNTQDVPAPSIDFAPPSA
jgi:hypothetical protein